MGIALAFRGFAYSFLTNPFFCIFKGIAVDRAGRLTVGTGRIAVNFAVAFVRKMKSSNTGCNDARSILTNTGRSEVCHVAVQALGAAVGILVDTGIIIKAFVARAGADDTLTILAVCILCALRIAFAAVQWVTFELIFQQTHRICIGTAIDHVIIACIGALSVITSSGFGVFSVRTDRTAGTAVTEIAAMDVDAYILIFSYTK